MQSFPHLDLIRDCLAEADEAGPLYRSLGDGLSQLIESGALPAGARLPSERQLTDLSGKSRVTIRKALALLAERGLVHQKKGSGTYVSDRADSAPVPPVTSLTDILRRQGRTSRTIWLKRHVAPATYHDRLILGRPALEQVVRLERLRLVDERPMSLERSTFTTEALPDVSMIDQSIYAALRANRSLPSRVVQEVSAVNMVPKVAERLRALPAAAALKITRRGFDRAGAIIEHTEAVFHPEAHRIVSEFGS
ncbi:GntR family transcriptional regulator [Oceanicola sp. S124]|uniref:GntR family transcriptional regulator n=1 Tax=Oceanicola sp. S124 TaxID=1042378 RepID=UPI0002557A41|nr:GntR family transcriptional regulator [Oceanicola sp. S124]